MLRSLLFVFLTIVICLPDGARSAESSPVTSAHDVATLVTDRDSVSAGKPLRVGLRLQLKPGWHTYWLNAGDAGDAPTLKTEVSGAMIGRTEHILFPTPVRIAEGGLMSYAYTGDVLLPQNLKPEGHDGAVTLKAHAEWLVCAATCVPEQGDFTLNLPPSSGLSAPSAQEPQFRAALQARPIASPFAAAIASDGVLSLTGQGLSPQSVHKAWFMPSVSGVIDQVAPQQLEVTQGKATLGLHWIDATHRPDHLDGIVVLQDEAGQQTSLWIETKPGAAAIAATGSSQKDGRVGASDTSLLQMILFAFVGGLILNLMPCVFPVLAMKAFSLARLGGSGRREQVGSALAYTVGVMGSFAALGIAMIALRGLGSAAGWGFQFQSPVFVIGVSWLLVLMALNLLGVFEVTLGRLGQDVTPRHGPWGDMLTGLLAVIVATPCTAPFMGAAIAAALGGPAWAGLMIFLAMGFGLAAPYIAIATIPALARRVPRPGEWMAILKQGLAFPLLATSVWLLWVASVQRGVDIVPLAAGGAVGLGLAAWLFGLTQRKVIVSGATRGVVAGRILALAAVILVGFALARVVGADADTPSPGPSTGQHLAKGAVTPYAPDTLAKLRSEGKPVFIDMTAAWCITCMVNERVALQSTAVQKEFQEKGVTYMKGDWTNRNATISAFLRDHGRDGVPLYVYYPPHQEGRILPQILTVSGVIEVLR